MERSETQPMEIEKNLEMSNGDNKTEPEPKLKKGKNAEKCRRYREHKKAEALQLTALSSEQEEPLEITLSKKKNAEKSRRYRKQKKIEKLTNNPQVLTVSEQDSMFIQKKELSFIQIQPSAASTRHIKLRQENTANFKQAIISGAELNAEHINNFQDIIANWFLNFRPIDVHLITLPQYVRPISNLQKHIQVMSGATHWICTYYDGNIINIYDSLNIKNLCPEQEVFLNQLFPHKPERKFHTVRQQLERDSGVYAIAFSTSLLNNRDPSKENYDHPKMRSHLLDIYNTAELLTFPIEPSADALRKRKANNVIFQHKEHTAAALHMRKVRAQKKLERLQEETKRHQCVCCLKVSADDQLERLWGDDGDEERGCSPQPRYGEVLVDCFALNWSPPRYPARSASQRICAHCIERVLEAARFKAQLAGGASPRHPPIDGATAKMKLERASDDNDEDDSDDDKTDDKNNGDVIDVELEPITEVTVKMEPLEDTNESSAALKGTESLQSANEKIESTANALNDVIVKVETFETNDAESLNLKRTKRESQSANSPKSKIPKRESTVKTITSQGQKNLLIIDKGIIKF